MNPQNRPNSPVPPHPLPGAAALLALVVAGAGCDGGPRPAGLWLAPSGDGPRVNFDIDARPLPEVPFPNDIATRLDPTSPTSRRVNVSVVAGTTELERGVRAKADALEGFGTFASAWASFDRPIDLCTIAARHHADDRFDNDAVYLVNVTPGHRNYGRPMLLDLGRGNFPIALPKTNNYFENDSRSDGDNLVFETKDEDVNRDGVLQLEEDSDADGHLDRPTLLPACPTRWRYDRPTFYESETNTLIMRPVLPLDEGATYAVILTTRLRGERAPGEVEGKPVRSPFPWVNHARQTAQLRPLADKAVVTGLGLRWDDRTGTSPEIAFTWAFTTQRPTEVLVAIRRGMAGGGPLGFLKERFPPRPKPTPLLDRPVRVNRAKSCASNTDCGGSISCDLEVKLCACRADADCDPGDDCKSTTTGAGSLVKLCGRRYPTFAIPADWFLDKVGELLARAAGGGSGPSVKALLDGIRDNVDYFVAGTVKTPNFLVDKNGQGTGPDNPGDDDEIFDIDLNTGRATVEEGWTDFWCSIPKPREGHGPPYPVAFYGHGYTSNKVEMLGFAGPMARLGIAHCGVNAFGHGLDIPDDIQSIVELVTSTVPVANFVKMLEPGRARDLNNDTVLDSGGDFWTADTFHTRDIVRQSIVEHMAVIQAMREFDGTRAWDDVNADGKPDLAGDWNGDGVIDLGGPNAKYHAWGQSLGGFISSLLAAVEPAIVAAAPVAGGGGLADVGIRSVQGGVVEAVFLRIMGPIVIGRPTPAGLVDLVMLVPDVNSGAGPKGDGLVIARDRAIAAGDAVTLRNLVNGEERTVVAGAQGRFRLAIAADAVNPVEKRRRLRLTPNRDPTEWMRVDDPRQLGDALVIEVRDAGVPRTERPRLVVDKFGVDVPFQGTIYPQDAPLAALQEGFGLIRQTPSFRRFMVLAQLILEPADPVNYAPHFHLDPFRYDDVGETATPGANLLDVPTVGDMNVPVNTGIAIAKAAGILEVNDPGYCYVLPQNRRCYGMTPNDKLIQKFVLEGLHRLERFGRPQQFDADDLSNGLKTWKPGDPPDFPDFLRLDPPLRATVPAVGKGRAGMRIPYVTPKGDHGFAIPDPTAEFDINTYMAYLVADYFASDGERLVDDPCYEKANCPWFPK